MIHCHAACAAVTQPCDARCQPETARASSTARVVMRCGAYNGCGEGKKRERCVGRRTSGTRFLEWRRAREQDIAKVASHKNIPRYVESRSTCSEYDVLSRMRAGCDLPSSEKCSVRKVVTSTALCRLNRAAISHCLHLSQRLRGQIRRPPLMYRPALQLHMRNIYRVYENIQTFTSRGCVGDWRQRHDLARSSRSVCEQSLQPSAAYLSEPHARARASAFPPQLQTLDPPPNSKREP
eukprot:910358-Pleurochrysis_carterae.AAC.8